MSGWFSWSLLWTCRFHHYLNRMMSYYCFNRNYFPPLSCYYSSSLTHSATDTFIDNCYCCFYYYCSSHYHYADENFRGDIPYHLTGRILVTFNRCAGFHLVCYQIGSSYWGTGFCLFWWLFSSSAWGSCIVLCCLLSCQSSDSTDLTLNSGTSGEYFPWI